MGDGEREKGLRHPFLTTVVPPTFPFFFSLFPTFRLWLAGRGRHLGIFFALLHATVVALLLAT